MSRKLEKLIVAESMLMEGTPGIGSGRASEIKAPELGSTKEGVGIAAQQVLSNAPAGEIGTGLSLTKLANLSPDKILDSFGSQSIIGLKEYGTVVVPRSTDTV